MDLQYKLFHYLNSDASNAYIDGIIQCIQKYYIEDLTNASSVGKKEFLKTNVLKVVEMVNNGECPKPANFDEYCANTHIPYHTATRDNGEQHPLRRSTKLMLIRNQTRVDVHGVWKNDKLLLPSKNAFDALLAFRDIVKSECKTTVYWNPEDVYEKMVSIGNMPTLTMNDVDGMLYQKSETFYLYESTKGPYRAYNPETNQWDSIIITNVKKYAKGFTCITAKDVKTGALLDNVMNTTMMYSIAL